MNRHLSDTIRNGQPLVITGYEMVDAMLHMKCSVCGSDPGYYCETKTGEARGTHKERTAMLPPLFREMLMIGKLPHEEPA